MSSIIREIKKRSQTCQVQADSEAQSIMTVRINAHTLRGVNHGDVWTWTCDSLPEFMNAIKEIATPVGIEQAMNLFFRFTNAVSFTIGPITKKRVRK